jgi:hypothetical protein
VVNHQVDNAEAVQDRRYDSGRSFQSVTVDLDFLLSSSCYLEMPLSKRIGPQEVCLDVLSEQQLIVVLLVGLFPLILHSLARLCDVLQQRSRQLHQREEHSKGFQTHGCLAEGKRG